MDDLSEKKITRFFYGLASIYLVNQIAFLVCLFSFYYIGIFTTFTSCLLFLIYMLVQYYFLNKNDFVEPTFYKIANPVLLAAVIGSVIAFASLTD
jgi:hypothetical protein